MNSDTQLQNHFRDLLRQYKESGIVYHAPGGRARYCVRDVEDTRACIRRLTANEDDFLTFSHYTNKATDASLAGGRLACDDFSHTVAVQATSILGDLFAISQNRKSIVHLPNEQIAKKCFIEAMENLPVRTIMGKPEPILPAIMEVVIRGVADGHLTENEISLDWLSPRTCEMLATIGLADATSAEVAEGYFLLSNEFFWHLAYYDPGSFFPNSPNEDKLRSSVRFAKIKNVYWDVIKADSKQGRSLLDVLANKWWPTRPNANSAPIPPTTSGPPNGQRDLQLFITPSLYQELQDALKRKKNLILEGPPGVGKTFIATRLASDFVGDRPPNVQMVQFHQSYSYEDFVQGYRPSSQGGFERVNQVFFRFCELARASPHSPFVFVIDEINRGNVSKIFGELLMLIEPDKRHHKYALPLTYSVETDKPFFVPENVHIIGLMNTADRGLAMVDYALRRRFCFFRLRPQFHSASFTDHLVACGVDNDIIQLVVERLVALNKTLESELGQGHEIGHSFFCPSGSELAYGRQWFDNIIEWEVGPLLREFYFDDIEKAEEYIDRLQS